MKDARKLQFGDNLEVGDTILSGDGCFIRNRIGVVDRVTKTMAFVGHSRYRREIGSFGSVDVVPYDSWSRVSHDAFRKEE